MSLGVEVKGRDFLGRKRALLGHVVFRDLTPNLFPGMNPVADVIELLVIKKRS